MAAVRTSFWQNGNMHFLAVVAVVHDVSKMYSFFRKPPKNLKEITQRT